MAAPKDDKRPQFCTFQSVGEESEDILVAVNGDQRLFQRDTEIEVGDEPGQIPKHFITHLKTCTRQVQKKRRDKETGRDVEYHDEVLRYPFTVTE